MNILNGIKHSFLLIAFLVLSGCFEVQISAPTEVTQNTIFTMEASSDGNEGDVMYEWFINDKKVSENQSYHTLFTELGSNRLLVKAIDENGNEDQTERTITVIPQASLNADFTFAIKVSDKFGFAIEGAEVSGNGDG